MAEFVSLTCPSCGSKLQVGNDLERFACGYCGNELVVKRGGGIVSLSPVVEGLQRVERAVQHLDVGMQRVGAGVDTTASELALQRLEKELVAVESQLASVPSGRPGCAVALVIFGVIGLLLSSGSVEWIAGGLIFLVVGGLWWWFAKSSAENVRRPLIILRDQLRSERLQHLRRVTEAR